MNRRRLLSLCAASVGISGCAGGFAPGPPSPTTPSPTRTDGDSDERQWTESECAPVPDLTISNLTPRSITVTITITAVTERYRGESPTPTTGETPLEETPVQTFSDTFELEGYAADDHSRDHTREYDSVPRKTGWHRLDVDVKEGPEKTFPFQPPYGRNSGFKVYLEEDDGLEGGEGGSHCDG